jgi:energy-coupling factor transporter ATP-binding protein EcfA2
MAKTQSPNSEVTERVRRRIKKASELESHKRILIYGRSGAGKTRLASSAPKVLLIDVNEKGTDSVRRDLDPDVASVTHWQEINDIFWYLQEGNHDYESVAIDGATAMQNLCMKFVLGDEKARDASRDPDMPSRQVWGKVGELMKTQVTNYRNLPMNVIFTALVRTRAGGEDEADETLYTGPALSPSIGGHLEAAVGMIGFLTTREVVVKRKNGQRNRVVRRRLMVGPSERYMTKDRDGLFPQYVDNPDLTAMLEYINQGGNDSEG